MLEDNLSAIIDRIIVNYEDPVISYHDADRHFPSRTQVKNIIKDTRNILFPRFYEEGARASSEAQYFVGNTILRVADVLYGQVREAFLFRDANTMSLEEIERRSHDVVENGAESSPIFRKCS